MSATASKSPRKLSGKLKPLVFSLILSMSLTGCGAFGTKSTQTRLLTPTYQQSELVCATPPRGQLAPTTTNEEVADRIVGIDEAGEDCRQKLARIRMKQEIFDDVVNQINEGTKPEKVKPKKKDD